MATRINYSPAMVCKPWNITPGVPGASVSVTVYGENDTPNRTTVTTIQGQVVPATGAGWCGDALAYFANARADFRDFIAALKWCAELGAAGESGEMFLPVEVSR